MLAPVGPAAKRLAGFALLALLAFAATQWPHVFSWAAPVATAADSAVLEVKCVPLSIQSADLSATAAGCSAAAGSGKRPQSGYSVEPHPSATADGGSDCQLDCERAGHAHLDVTSLGIQTKESHIDFAGDHRVAHPGVCNDAGSPSHTSTDVVAEVLGSTGTCATARHFSSFFSKSISLPLVFFSVLLRSLGVHSHSRHKRLLLPEDIVLPNLHVFPAWVDGTRVTLGGSPPLLPIAVEVLAGAALAASKPLGERLRAVRCPPWVASDAVSLST